MEDRSALFNQLKEFSQRKLKKVETKVVTGTGEQLVEKRGAKGLQVLTGAGGGAGADNAGQEPPRKLDLQVGFILPGLLLGSQDVAHDKSSLESYGITHILSLDRDVANKFEDDYNYKNVSIQDKPDFELDKVLDECFDFIDDGRHYGNVFVHCSGTIGLSRSTTICVAYLMNKEKQAFSEAFNNVKEARSFVKPNEGFQKQLKDYEVKLRGAQQVKDSGIDDPFALRKKQEIEQEKAMVAGAASVKNRMKMFGANLEADPAPSGRSKSASPSPYKQQQKQQQQQQQPTPQPPRPSPASTNQTSSKWSSGQNVDKFSSKSMTPEPRQKSWQQTPSGPPPPPPPPPPPIPDASLFGGSDRSTSKQASSSSNKSSLPPPPPPPSSLMSGSAESTKADKPAASIKSRYQPQENTSSSSSTTTTTTTTTAATTTNATSRKGSVSEASEDETGGRRVFGRRPPPPMKIRGGLSIERHDSVSSDKSSEPAKGRTTQAKSSLQLPLKKQFTTDSEGEGGKSSDNPRAPSPSAALRAAKQQVAAKQKSGGDSTDGHKPSGGQINRSSTKKLLNLIKTKTKTDLTLSDGDENDEIEALLGALESESIDNIDWDELGLDENEVKDIIKQGGDASSSSSSSSSSEDEDGDDDDDDEEEEEEVERSTLHYVIRTK